MKRRICISNAGRAYSPGTPFFPPHVAQLFSLLFVYLFFSSPHHDYLIIFKRKCQECLQNEDVRSVWGCRFELGSKAVTPAWAQSLWIHLNTNGRTQEYRSKKRGENSRRHIWWSPHSAAHPWMYNTIDWTFFLFFFCIDAVFRHRTRQRRPLFFRPLR